MVRSLWLGVVAVGLVEAALVQAQAPSPPPGAASARDRFITVRENGRPPQRCKVLKTWREPDGVSAYQVQAVDTGEVMTIVEAGRPASAPGTPRVKAMPTRIFRWGPDNTPPEQAPKPPSDAAVSGAPLGRLAPQAAPMAATPSAPIAAPVVQQTPRVQAPPPSAPPVIVTTPRLAPTPTTTPQFAPQPAPTLSASPFAPIRPVPTDKPAAATVLTTPASKPIATAVSATPANAAKNTSAAPTSPETPRILHGPITESRGTKDPEPRPLGSGTPPRSLTVAAPTGGSNLCDCTPAVPPQPRLVPSACATGACPTTCGNGSSCDACCQPCDPCACQPSCVCCPPPRQSLLRRIFQSNPAPTVVVCPPAASPPTAPTPPSAAPPSPSAPPTTTAAVPPRDWRESWGKVEPWAGTAQANADKPAAPAKQAARAPVPSVPPQPDPLKEPDWYHHMALKEKPVAKITPAPLVPPDPPRVEYKPALVATVPPPASSTSPVQTARTTPAGPPSTPPHGRAVEIAANESNAFWAAPAPKPPQGLQPPKYNAFARDDNAPPGDAAARMGQAMGPMPGGGGPMGPMPMMPPRPPMMPSMVDSGVPSGMGNAFTLAGTRRPIPADFGPTPQEPNGFGEAMPYMPAQGPIVPPRTPMLPPSPGMLGYLPPPMPPQGPVTGINPLMTVPPVALQSMSPTVRAGLANVPQALATLRDSLYPSYREWAVEGLSRAERTHPAAGRGSLDESRPRRPGRDGAGRLRPCPGCHEGEYDRCGGSRAGVEERSRPARPSRGGRGAERVRRRRRPSRRSRRAAGVETLNRPPAPLYRTPRLAATRSGARARRPRSAARRG